MTENTVETVQSSFWNFNNLLNNLTKERLIYLAIALVLVGAIVFYLKYVRNSEKLLNTPNFNNELLQQLQQQQLQQQLQQQPQQMEYPKKVMMDAELVEDLRKRNMTPQDYIFELQKTGQFPPGPMPEVVVEENNVKKQEQLLNNKSNEKKENNLNDLKLDEDEEEYEEDEEENETSDKEDDNLKNEDLSKEEMDNIKEKLLRLQKPSAK